MISLKIFCKTYLAHDLKVDIVKMYALQNSTKTL